jgi:DNA-binding CsgD family transcriptional regulator
MEMELAPVATERQVATEHNRYVSSEASGQLCCEGISSDVDLQAIRPVLGAIRKIHTELPGIGRKGNRVSHPLFKTWSSMLDRCYRQSASGFKYYGGRGVQVCDSWRFDFWTFVADMGVRPEGCTLDRIDNDGDYHPKNCRWATPAQQNANKRRRPPQPRKKRVRLPAHFGAPLTEQELAVLQAASTGLRHGELAAQVHMSPSMFAIHMSRVMDKTGCKSKFQLGIWYANELQNLGAGK